MMGRKSKSGFTLVEVIIAMGLMAIMAAIATPNVAHYMKSQRLAGACRQLFTDFTNARSQAISQNNNIIIELTNHKSYRIIRDINNNSTVDTGETGITRSIQPMYHDVTFNTGAVSFKPIFYPNGTGNNGTIYVTSSSLSRTKKITISTAGRIKINR